MVLALLQPLGILADQGLGARLFYWARTVGVGYLLHRPALWLGGRLALKAGKAEWIGWIGGLLLASALMALWLWYFGPSINPARAFPSDALWAETAGQVLVISSLIALCMWFIDSLMRQHQPAPVVAPIVQERPPILARTPWPLSRLIALEGEDHYVRVHTDYGSHLVLIRMADAVNEAASVDGYSVHRSWWVARDAVQEAKASGRTLTLALEGGLVVPVARSRVAEVKRWLA